MGLELCPIQDRLCSRRPSRRCQNRDCWGRGRRSVLRLGERSESSPDSMITSPVPTTEAPSSTGSDICPCNRLLVHADGRGVGWHTFRHTYSTLLGSVGTESKVMQELLRHSTIRSTLDVYTQAITPAKQNAQAAVMSLGLLFSVKSGTIYKDAAPGRIWVQFGCKNAPKFTDFSSPNHP